MIFVKQKSSNWLKPIWRNMRACFAGIFPQVGKFRLFTNEMNFVEIHQTFTNESLTRTIVRVSCNTRDAKCDLITLSIIVV